MAFLVVLCIGFGVAIVYMAGWLNRHLDFSLRWLP